jgi:hypothetical protein
MGKNPLFLAKTSVQGLSSLQKLTNSKTKVGKWAENWPNFDLQLSEIVADRAREMPRILS